MKTEVNKTESNHVKKIMPFMLIIFVLVTLMQHAFSIASPLMAEDFQISISTVSLQITISTVVLGVCSVIYGTLSDFLSIKKLLLFGIGIFLVGSVLGFVLQWSFYGVVLARALQTVGQASIGSLYLVMASRYLEGITKVKYFGYFTACFQLSQAIGVIGGGVISTYVRWSILFLIPLVIIFLIPSLLKNLPAEEPGGKKRIDWLGLILLGALVMCINLFFSQFAIVFLISAICLAIMLAAYIINSKNAFISVDFFKNRRYMTAVGVIILLYFSQFAFSFLYSFFGKAVLKETLDVISYILLPGYLAAVIAGTLGGKITEKIGHFKTAMLGGSSIFLGLAGTALFMGCGRLAMSITAALFFAGYAVLYSPMVDIVVRTLPKNEIGRGIGFNDLFINISASVGVTIVGRILTDSVFSGIPAMNSLFNVNADYAGSMLLCAAIVVIALVTLLLNRKRLTDEKEDKVI